MNHGDHSDCGYAYAVDESTQTAFCGACGHRFETCLPKFPRGTIVRYTAKALKNTFGQGGRGAPINGRIVGAASHWPIVQWSNGTVTPIADAALQVRS